MIEISKNLWISDIQGCHEQSSTTFWPGTATIHACKSPCHQNILNYKGSLPSFHPNKLFLEKEKDLYLNIVDSDKPIYYVEIFQKSLEFIEKHIYEKVIIHCNQGLSRAPTIGLIYLSKRIIRKDLPYKTIKKEFQKHIPYYPSRGLDLWLEENWNNI